MTAIRKIMKPKNRMLHILLPEEMDNESDYEVIVLKMDSVSEETQSTEDPFDWDPENENETKAWTMTSFNTIEEWKDNKEDEIWK